MAITVNPVNDVPVCSADTSSGDEDADQSGTLACTDARQRPADLQQGRRARTTAARPSTPTAPGATAPNANFNGSDSFTFRANDGTVNSNTVTLSITVDSVNDAPVCSADTSSGNEDADQSGTITCTDADGDALTYAKVGGPATARRRSTSDGSWSYSPDANFNGSDSFTFRANDGSDNSNTATMSITVNAVNDAPVCQDLSLATAKNVAVGGTVTCTDVENDPLVLRVSTRARQRHGRSRSTRPPAPSPTRRTWT